MLTQRDQTPDRTISIWRPRPQPRVWINDALSTRPSHNLQGFYLLVDAIKKDRKEGAPFAGKTIPKHSKLP